MKAVNLLILISCIAWSAEKVPLSLKKAVEIALAPDGSTRTRLATEAVAQSKTRVGQARATLLPNLDATVGAQDFTRNLQAMGLSFSTPIPGLALPVKIGPISNFDARLNGTLTIFDFSAWKRYDAAKTGVAAAQAESESARNIVAEQVARTYVAALRAQASVTVARANVALAESLKKLALDQKETGTGTGIEVVRADVQLTNERQRLILLENDARRTLLQLARLINLGLDRELELTDTLVIPEANVPGLDEALAAARDNRKDLSAQSLREQISRRTYESVKWERLPSIQAYGDFGTIGIDIENALTTRTYGATLRIPLWDGGRRDARRAEAAIQLKQDEIKTQDLRKQVELDVRLALDALATGARQVEASAETVRLAEAELAQAQRRYEAGVTNSIEVVDAQNRTERARDTRVLALYQYNQARIDLAAAMGAIHRILQ